ncbi:MAG TPA: HAD family hydrolase [Actinomycetota bacterium]|nr:HAD family hydrolase [Actinomycetota bacterium]
MTYLVATDLDGTLLRRDFSVSDRTRRALQEAVGAGVGIVYATGRPPRWLGDVYDETGLQPTTICANGALTLQGDELLHVDEISAEVIREVQQILWARHPDFVMHTEQWQGHTLKLLAALPGADGRHADEVLQEVRALAGHLVEPTHSMRSRLLIEMSAVGVTKAGALARVRHELWPHTTVIAVGDMPNDEAMLRSADLPMTVTSGHPWLRGVTERILPGPDQDGVAQLLERLVAGDDPWPTGGFPPTG